MQSCRHKTGDMSHIHHKHSSCLIGHLAKNLKIDGTGIGGGPRNDHPGPGLQRRLPKFIIIDKALVVNTVRYNVKIFSGHIHGASVGQMSAVIQIHSHDRVAGLAYGKLNRHIGLSAGMRLHIGILAPKQLFGPFNRQLLYHIHALASAIIPFSRIPFRIFVGERTSHCRHHRPAHPVFRGNQLDMAVLSGLFIHYGLGHLRIHTSHIIQRIHSFSS